MVWWRKLPGGKGEAVVLWRRVTVLAAEEMGNFLLRGGLYCISDGEDILWRG